MCVLCVILYIIYLWTCLTLCLVAIFSLRLNLTADCTPFIMSQNADPLYKNNFLFFPPLVLSLASQSQSIRFPSFQVKTELIGFMVASLRLNLVQEMLTTVPLSPGNLMQNCFLLLRKKWFVCNAQALLNLDVSLSLGAFCWYGFVSL